MIEKLLSIQNLGRFSNYRASGDVEMRNLTLLYGENGRGKTTLCSLFRSLMTGDTPPLQARQTLGQVNRPAAEVRANGQTLRLQNGAWSTTLPEITVFDSEFVHQNIYSGDQVARDQRRNSYRVIIGAQGVQFAQQIDQYDADIRSANGNIRQHRDQIQRYIEGNMSIDDFLQIPQVADVDAQIQAKIEEVAAVENRIQQAAQIQAKGQPQPLATPVLPTGIADILAKTIPDVSLEAEALVKEHILQHLDPNGERWVEEGTRYALDGECPFCGQDLTNSNLISLYGSYFNESYRQLKQDVSTLPDLVTSSLRGNVIANMARTMAANADLMAFWGRFFDLPLPEVPAEQLQETLVNAAEALSVSVAAKQQAPLEAVPMPTQWQEIQAHVEDCQQAINTYNQKVQEINAAISELKQPQRQDAIHEAKADLLRLQLAKKRYEPAVVPVCTAYINEVTRKQQLSAQKAAVKTQLDQHCQTVLQPHQDDLNRYLTQFGTSFRIANSRHNYVGGTPSSHFQIEINNEAVELGDDRTLESTPSFKTALSAGDRSALALAFFIATLRRDPNLAQKIVILDDPFCSQDRFRRASTQYLISKLAEDCDQVIVLSHDPHFLNAVEQNTQAAGVARLQAVAVGVSVEISSCDLSAIIECPLAADRARLGAFISAGQGVPMDVARAIRPVIEGHLRQAAPGSFIGMHMLGNMITAIRVSTPGDPLHRFAGHVEELEQINVYSSAFHHPAGDATPMPQVDGAELKGFATRALNVVGGI